VRGITVIADEARRAAIEKALFVAERGEPVVVEHLDHAFKLETTMTERASRSLPMC